MACKSGARSIFGAAKIGQYSENGVPFEMKMSLPKHYHSRLIELPKDHSFFLFGPRGSGKSTLISKRFGEDSCLTLNLLDYRTRERFIKNPDDLQGIVRGLPPEKTHVFVDEVQKVPQLLDTIHLLIEETDIHFILTGSSSRKLKYGGANLLAGRAFVYHLYPYSYFEIEGEFVLEEALRWGMLPKVLQLERDTSKLHFLQSYAHTYLREEIWEEQFIRDLEPFRRFIEVAAQMNGKIINVSNIARDVGVDDKTVKNYYSLLEDTLLGFHLDSFQHSFRKRLNTKPKFYFFDTGLSRALSRRLSLPIMNKTTSYGDAFEHFIILEVYKLCSWYQPEYRLSFLSTKDNAEVDLVVERPGLPILFIEIKSTDHISLKELTTFAKLAHDFGECEAICLSNDPYEKQLDSIRALPWKEGLKRYFRSPSISQGSS